MSELKLQLYSLCKQHVAEQIVSIEAAIADRRDAMHNETKSSMGDKYETTREMLQQDISMNQNRLSAVKADDAVLGTINPETTSSIVALGSVVCASNGNFYMAISAGSFTIAGKKYYAISASSPIGVQLKGKQEGDNFTLNGKEHFIEQVL